MSRSVINRSKKYENKLVGDVIKNRAENYGDTQKSNFKTSISDQVRIERIVKSYMQANLIKSIDTNYYILFAKNMLNKSDEEADFEFNKWALRGLNWAHLRSIGRIINNRRLDLREVCKTPGNVLYLSMFRGTGTKVKDLSGSGNDGTIFTQSDATATDEVFNSNTLDSSVQLAHKEIRDSPVPVVKSSDGLITYVENTDYTINLSLGQITCLSTGAIPSDTNCKITYHYDNSGAAWTSGGVLGNALSFDGVDDYISLSDKILDGSTNFTICSWVKFPVVPSTTQLIFQERETAAKSISFYYKGANTRWELLVGNGTDYDSTIYTHTPIINQWYHIVAIFDAGATKIYIDGVEKVSDTLTVVKVDTGTATYKQIGKFESANFFNGTIDEVRIYNRALTPAEIKAHYEAEKPK